MSSEMARPYRTRRADAATLASVILLGMNGTTALQLGYLIVGHGTRDPLGQSEFREVVRLLAEKLAQPVASAFLELAEPTIPQGLAELAAKGVRQVVVVPLLLFTAGHAKDDVPAAVAAAAATLGLEVVGQSGALELQPHLLELSRLRFWEAVGSATDLAGVRLLMVGRGGSDPEALDAMRSYTAALSASLGVAGETAFAALARPSLAEAIDAFAECGAAQIVVQPHLLFEGEVSQAINRQVAQAKEAYPHIKWLIARHLGPHPLLIEAILAELARENPSRARGRKARPGE
jgi:sirohydrochlorin cobaltochelatase